MIQDQYTDQAKLDTNTAWAYPSEAPWATVVERDQAKWDYAVEQRAARLRLEAALKHLLNTIEIVAKAGRPLTSLLVRSMRDIRTMFGSE